jgi:hypothetical protein
MSVQAVPEQPTTTDMGSVVEAPSGPGGKQKMPSLPKLIGVPTKQSTQLTPAPLPGYGVNSNGLQEVQKAKQHYDAAQWLLLCQFLFVFWGFVVVVLVGVFSLERCQIFGRPDLENAGFFKSAVQKTYMSRTYFLASSVVLVGALVATSIAVYLACFTTPPVWFNKLEKAEAAVMKSLPFQIPGLSPTAPPPPPTVSPVKKAQMAASSAKTEYKAVSNQLDQMKTQLAQQKQATRAKETELAQEKAKNQKEAAAATPAPTPAPAPTPPPTQAPVVTNLAAKVAALKKTAQAKAAVAAAVTPAPTTVAPAPAAPPPPAAGWKNAGMSPCTTIAPALQTVAQPALPKITNFIPPAPCNCKLSDLTAKGLLHYDPFCKEYPGKWVATPVCVVDNPTCNPGTEDALQQNGDKLVKCIAAPAGGGTPFTVTIDTSLAATTPLGMKILPDQTLMKLIVTSISGGVVQQYNTANPGAVIKVGDMITAVNGLSGSSVKLLQECMKKEKLVLSMLHSVGSPVAAAAAAPAVPAGKCPANVHPWGTNSVCLSNQKPSFTAGYLWHCPWESMMLVSTKTFGGCPAVKYDCAGMDVNSVLNLYSTHSTMAGPPPEGSLQTVQYVSCCIKSQCQGQPLANCGEAPWIPGQSVSPFVGKASPCGAAGCARLFSVAKVQEFLPKGSGPLAAVTASCLLLVAAAILAIRRRTGQRTDHHDLLAENDAEACPTEVE